LSPGLWTRQRIRSAGLGLVATYPRVAWRIGLLIPFPVGACATADVVQHANRTAIQQRILMLPSGRPQAQVHRGSQTKQHTSFFVRTLTWLIDGFCLRESDSWHKLWSVPTMHLRPATSRGNAMRRSPVPRQGRSRARARHPVAPVEAPIDGVGEKIPTASSCKSHRKMGAERNVRVHRDFDDKVLRANNIREALL
jgi:hypothetical protein